MAVQFDLRHLPQHESEHGLKIKSICKVCWDWMNPLLHSHRENKAAILLADPSRKPEKSDLLPSQPSENGTVPMIPPKKVRTISALRSIKEHEFIGTSLRKPSTMVRNLFFLPSVPSFQASSMHQTCSIDSRQLAELDVAGLFPALQTLARSCSTR